MQNNESGAVRLSKSVLWQIQKEFYLRHGAEFWKKRDSFTSSNMSVVTAVADAVISLLRTNFERFDLSKPIYFLEIGSGSGSFAYRFLTVILTLIEADIVLKPLKIRFVATDIVPGIVELWKTNSFFEPLVTQGLLDFAVFDPFEEQMIGTICNDWRIGSESFVNVPFVFANSVFDTIAVDGFVYDRGYLSEVLSTVRFEGADALDSLISNTLQVDQSLRLAVKEPYYDEPAKEKVLRSYEDRSKQIAFTIPVGAFSIVENIRRLTDDRFILFCCSRGYTDIPPGTKIEDLKYHDLSFPLNFDALKKYFEVDGGALFFHKKNYQKPHSALAFGVTKGVRDKMEVGTAALPFIRFTHELLSGEEFEKDVLNGQLRDTSAISSIEIFLQLMDVGGCDPQLFIDFVAKNLDRIEAEIPTTLSADLQRMKTVLRKINHLVFSLHRQIPVFEDTDDALTLLLRVWQRANAASSHSSARALFGA